MLAHVPHKTFSVDQYYRMAEAGIFGRDDRVELIEGEIIQMSPIGSRHAAVLSWLTAFFVRRLGERANVRTQAPIHLSEISEPEPDLCLARPRNDFYRDRHPVPDDVFLLVEVSDTSLPFDREVKAPLYARHGVRELWIVDLITNALEVHRRPGTEGYGDVRRLGPSDKVAPEAFSDVIVAVGEMVV